MDISQDWSESWANIEFSGIYEDSHNKSYFEELYQEVVRLDFAGAITLYVDNEIVDFLAYKEEIIAGSEWRVHINKLPLTTKEAERIVNFFYDKEKFKHWAESSDVTSDIYPLNQKPCYIEVRDLRNVFYGQNFIVSNGEITQVPEKQCLGYQEGSIASIIHSFTQERKLVLPSKHRLLSGEIDEYSAAFYRNAIKSMALALCNEIYDDHVVLRGIRRIEQGCEWIIEEGTDFLKYHDDLWNALVWVYDKDSRFELRHKLLLDRITLDIPENGNLYSGLYSLIHDALQQAKERYNFALYERSDQYNRELRGLLNDFRTVSDAYSSKVRSLLGGLSRDVLAALLTIGVSLLSRYNDFAKSGTLDILSFIFIAYGVYFIASFAYQTFPIGWICRNQ